MKIKVNSRINKEEGIKKYFRTTLLRKITTEPVRSLRIYEKFEKGPIIKRQMPCAS